MNEQEKTFEQMTAVEQKAYLEGYNKEVSLRGVNEAVATGEKLSGAFNQAMQQGRGDEAAEILKQMEQAANQIGSMSHGLKVDKFMRGNISIG